MRTLLLVLFVVVLGTGTGCSLIKVEDNPDANIDLNEKIQEDPATRTYVAVTTATKVALTTIVESIGGRVIDVEITGDGLEDGQSAFLVTGLDLAGLNTLAEHGVILHLVEKSDLFVP